MTFSPPIEEALARGAVLAKDLRAISKRLNALAKVATTIPAVSHYPAVAGPLVAIHDDLQKIYERASILAGVVSRNGGSL